MVAAVPDDREVAARRAYGAVVHLVGDRLGRAAWQVLAGAAGQDAFDAELRYRGVPFEVSYAVASWRRAA